MSSAPKRKRKQNKKSSCFAFACRYILLLHLHFLALLADLFIIFIDYPARQFIYFDLCQKKNVSVQSIIIHRNYNQTTSNVYQ